MSVLTKIFKDYDYKKKSYWRSFLRGRSWSQRLRTRFQIITNTVYYTISTNFLILFLNTVFLLILKRDRDRRVHERPHQNAQG